MKVHELRRAGTADRERLDALRREVYRDLFDATWGGWDEDRHSRHFEDSWSRGGIDWIVVDGVDVGMLQLERCGRRVEIREIQIAREYQGRGIGSAVVGALIDDARRDRTELVLSTGSRNVGAIRLYERLGFVVTAQNEFKVEMRLDAD